MREAVGSVGFSFGCVPENIFEFCHFLLFGHVTLSGRESKKDTKSRR